MKEEQLKSASKRRKRIGILGGNFNPIHNGHLNIAKKAYEQFGLDEVWFMPAWIQPLKRALPVARAEDRAAMVELAIRDNTDFSLCSYELEKKGVSYTCETLKELCRLYPDCEFFFLLGADSIYTLGSWKRPEDIFACATLLVACRRQKGLEDNELYARTEELREKYGARIEFIDTPFYDISSTKIRSLLEEDHMCTDILPEAVYHYIKEHGLYQKNNLQ